MPLAYVEAFYQWNFDDPSNGITAYRGFESVLRETRPDTLSSPTPTSRRR